MREDIASAWLCLLLISCNCCVLGLCAPLILTDADFGITTVNSLVGLNDQILHLRAYLRADCSSSRAGGLTVYGFIALLPFIKQPPSVLRSVHYQPYSSAHGSIPQLLLHNKQSGSRTPLKPTRPRGAASEGLLRVEAELDASGSYELEGGADDEWRAPLPTPCCSCQASSNSTTTRGGGASRASSPLANGLWNVLTTTSNSVLPLEDLAFLALQHNTYHRRLGFNGTILRGGVSQAQQLARLSSIQAAMKHEGLLLWPWSEEHSVGEAPHYWQIPKNQLALLAAYRTSARLVYLDLDEYIVFINATGNSLDSATCHGRPLLTPGSPSWNLFRFQTKSCNATADIDCWQAPGATPLPSSHSTPIYLGMCAMGASHGKRIVQADLTLTVGVHKATEAPGTAINSSMVSLDCAIILHLFSLNHGRRPVVTKKVMTEYPMSGWTLPAGQQGPASVAIPAGQQLRTEEECTELWRISWREKQRKKREAKQRKEREAKARAGQVAGAAARLAT